MQASIAAAVLWLVTTIDLGRFLDSIESSVDGADVSRETSFAKTTIGNIRGFAVQAIFERKRVCLGR